MNTDTADLHTVNYDALAALLTAAPKKSINKTVVDAPFSNKIDMAFLFLGFICLYVVDEAKNEVQLVAASGTEEYARAVERYNFNLTKFHLSLADNPDNTIVKAIVRSKPQDTT